MRGTGRHSRTKSESEYSMKKIDLGFVQNNMLDVRNRLGRID